MKKKIRKPREFHFCDHWFYCLGSDKKKAVFFGYVINLKTMKRLHKWLGKAIE